MGKNAIVGQSGGPTSVINASLAGVFESCKSRGADIVYGMCNGVAGLLEERVVDLSTVLTDDLDIELLKRTPSSFLGSCRYKLPDQKLFNAYWFGPPDGVTHPSTCPRVDHLVSRLLLPTIRPVQTRFRFGCRSEILNLAGKSNS